MALITNTPIHTGVQVNIRHGKALLPYRVIIEDGISADNGQNTSYCRVNDDVYFTHTDNPFVSENIYEQGNDIFINNSTPLHRYIPLTLQTSIVRLLFPQYSVETFRNTKYALFAYVYVNGQKIVFCGTLLDRNNAQATDEPVSYKNTEYYEEVRITIPSPEAVLYTTRWHNFRNNIIGNMNMSTVSMLNIDIVPVSLNENGAYRLIDGYQGGTNSLMPLVREQNGMSVHIINDHGIFIEGVYNSLYGNQLNGLPLFLENIYGLTTADVSETWYRLRIVYEGQDIYTYNYVYDVPGQTIVGHHIVSLNDFGWTVSWSDYMDGMFLVGEIECVDNNGNRIFIDTSNDVPITRELFAFFINDNTLSDSATDNYIDLNQVNMNVFTIDAVNKIVNEVVNVQRPEGYRSNIQQPIFLQAMPADGIEIHRGVAENIALNLDRYRAYTDMFYIRINGIDFPEIARNVYGVIFTIDGNMLGDDVESNGTYFVLDDNKNTITNGKYILSE